jgi:hypothetical protein
LMTFLCCEQIFITQTLEALTHAMSATLQMQYLQESTQVA